MTCISCSCKKIKQITFYVHNDTCYQKLDTITIDDVNKIKALQMLFDKKKQEPLKFMITYDIDFVYQDGNKERYSGQGKWIKNEKGSYILSSDSLINSILEKGKIKE